MFPDGKVQDFNMFKTSYGSTGGLKNSEQLHTTEITQTV